MEESNNTTNGNNTTTQQSYPDPVPTTQTPYPVLQKPTAYSPPPTSTYGAFPGSQAPLSYSAFPGSGSRHENETEVEHHVTNFSAFNAGESEPSHLAPVNPLSSRFTPMQQVAVQFQVRYGDPGRPLPGAASQWPRGLPRPFAPSQASPPPFLSPPPSSQDPPPPPQDIGPQDGERQTAENHSDLAGIWLEDTGGKAAQSAAWHARAMRHGGKYELDQDGDNRRDPDVEALFAGEEIQFSRPRGGPGSRGGKKRRGGWRQLLAGTEHANVGLAEKRGRGGGRGRARGKGSRGGRRSKPVDPGPDFKKYIQLANKAYMDIDLDAAADYARQAIQANPEIWQAHSLLAQILEQQGRISDAITAMKWGATCSKEPDVWIRTAEKMLEAAGEHRSKGILRDVVDCYNEVIKLCKTSKADEDLVTQVRMTMVEMYKELHDFRACRIQLRSLIKAHPMNTAILREYAMLAGQWQDPGDMRMAQEAYEKAFDLYKDAETFGAEDDDTDPFSHLNIYLDLVESRGVPAEGLFKAKQVARRFLGRKEEIFWERYVEDDREFDDGNDRRIYVGEVQQGRASQDPMKYGKGLPIEIKVKFGDLRLKMGDGHQSEALNHFEALLEYADEIEDYHDMFMAVGTKLRDAGMMGKAAEYYDCVRKVANADDPDYGLGDDTWMQMATCYQSLDRVDDAVACLEVMVANKGEKYGHACARLAKIYEDIRNDERARELIEEVILLNRRDLLYDAGVRMVPLINRPTRPPLPPEWEARLAANAAKMPKSPASLIPPPPPRNYRELLPNVPPPTITTLDDPIEKRVSFNGNRRKRNRKDNPDAPAKERPAKAQKAEKAEKAEKPAPVRRPRLKKATVPTKAQVNREIRNRHINDVGSRSKANFQVILQYWPAVKDGNDQAAIDEWVEAANGLLEDFLSMKVFFPDRDKHIKLRETQDPAKPFAGVHSHRTDGVSNPRYFLSIPFADWHHVFTDLALLYAKNGEQDRCYRIVQDVLFSANAFFQEPQLQNTSFAVAIYSGLAFNDSQYLIELARQIVTDSDYRGPMTYQLLAALNRFCYGSNWFSSGPTQKFMLRMVKMFDYLCMENEDMHDVRARMDWNAQKPSLEGKAQKMRDNNEEFPKEPDAGILLMYGHMVAVANHSHSSLPYYYRALALQPDNICINLSIATMWVQTSMKRQTANRQHGIMQGLAFLYRYYDLRVASGKARDLQEADFNVARMWHYLGLTHLAVPGYEKVLGLSERVQEENLLEGVDGDAENYAIEAAYALQGMWTLAGNMEAAREIGEKWLVI